MTNLRNALMTENRLPYDAEVEYLESTGTQYIDTGLMVDMSDTRIDSRIKFVNSFAYMARVNTEDYYWGLAAVRSDYGIGYSGQKRISITTNDWHDVSDRSDCLLVDGVNLWARTPISQKNPAPMLLFASSNAGVITMNRAAFGRFSISQGGILVRDYIPVRVGTTGELYDRVNGRFAERHGDLVFGPDKAASNGGGV